VQLFLKFAECLLPESSFVNERVAFTAHENQCAPDGLLDSRLFGTVVRLTW
jgi:hypothetical protein